MSVIMLVTGSFLDIIKKQMHKKCADCTKSGSEERKFVYQMFGLEVACQASVLISVCCRSVSLTSHRFHKIKPYTKT